MSGLNPEVKAWRCCSCKSLLGMRRGADALEIKHKNHAVTVVGATKVVVPCRRCGTENRTSVTAAA